MAFTLANVLSATITNLMAVVGMIGMVCKMRISAMANEFDEAFVAIYVIGRAKTRELENSRIDGTDRIIRDQQQGPPN